MSGPDKATDPGGRVMKVNHAGENGAVNIYRGQVFFARLTAPLLVPELRGFQSHEERHRQIFADELRRRNLRRCRSYVLCGLGGLVLGLITGLLGRGAIAATTVAVERVVLGHLKSQVETLEVVDAAATDAVRLIVAEEQEHHDTAVTHAQASKVWLSILTPVVSASTEVVIWTGMRL